MDGRPDGNGRGDGHDPEAVGDDVRRVPQHRVAVVGVAFLGAIVRSAGERRHVQPEAADEVAQADDAEEDEEGQLPEEARHDIGDGAADKRAVGPQAHGEGTHRAAGKVPGRGDDAARVNEPLGEVPSRRLVSPGGGVDAPHLALRPQPYPNGDHPDADAASAARHEGADHVASVLPGQLGALGGGHMVPVHPLGPPAHVASGGAAAFAEHLVLQGSRLVQRTFSPVNCKIN